MNRLTFLLSLLLVTTADSLGLEDFSVVDERRLHPVAGISFSRIEAASDRALLTGHLIEIDSSIIGARIDVATAGTDPWRSIPLNAIIAREEALAGIGIVDPFDPENRQGSTGFLFKEEAILLWSGDQPVMALGPDGLMRMGDAPSSDSAFVTNATGDWSLPLAGVNAVTSDGQVALWSGPLTGSAPPLATWPTGTRLVTLIPARFNAAPNRSFWDESLSNTQRLWIPGEPIPIDRAIIARDQWVLLMPPSMEDDEREKLLSAEAWRFHIPLTDSISHSIFAVGGDEWLMRDGQVVTSEEVDPLMNRNVIAVDRSGRKTWFAALESRSVNPLTDAQVAGILHGRGATDAVQFATSLPRLETSLESPDWRHIPTAMATRAALLAVNRPLMLSVAEGHPLNRLRFLAATGSDSTDSPNPPSAAIDGAIYKDESLTQFWAAQFDANAAPPWLELTLQPDSTLAVVDIFHAQNSGFSSHFNTRAYRILGRSEATAPWHTVFEVHHDLPTRRDRLRLDPPRRFSHLRIEIIDPGFLPNINKARVSEIMAWGEVDPGS